MSVRDRVEEHRAGVVDARRREADETERRVAALRSLELVGVQVPGDSAPAEVVEAFERRVRVERERLERLSRWQRVEERGGR